MKANKSKFQPLHQIETKSFLLLITKQYMYTLIDTDLSLYHRQIF